MDTPVITDSERLEAYSDAIFSIIATVMIVPIAHMELPVDEPLRDTFVSVMLPRIAVYIFTFLVICYVWSGHVWLFETIGTVDEVVVLLNLGLMMVTTFLPFTFTLLGLYMQDSLAIAIFCLAIIFLGIIQLILIYYVFYNEKRLEEEVRCMQNKTLQRNRIMFRVAMPVIFALIALALAYIWVFGALVVVFSILFCNYVRSKVVHIYHRCKGEASHREVVEYETPLAKKLLFETVAKERVECFSDGVFAIVATLVILDICEKNIPDKDAVEDAGSLVAALFKYWRTYVAYSGTFLTVGLQWYVHHSLLHYLKDMNKLMVFFNKLCLLSIGLTPLTFVLISDFETHVYDTNETMAIQLNCIVIFMAGLFQLVVWVTALYSQSQYVIEVGSFQGHEHYYIFSKLMVYPVASLIMFFITFTNARIRVVAFSVMEINICVLFLLMGLYFHKLRKYISHHGPLQLTERLHDDIQDNIQPNDEDLDDTRASVVT